MKKQKKHLMQRSNKKNMAKNARRIKSNMEMLKKIFVEPRDQKQ